MVLHMQHIRDIYQMRINSESYNFKIVFKLASNTRDKVIQLIKLIQTVLGDKIETSKSVSWFLSVFSAKTIVLSDLKKRRMITSKLFTFNVKALEDSIDSMLDSQT